MTFKIVKSIQTPILTIIPLSHSPPHKSHFFLTEWKYLKLQYHLLDRVNLKDGSYLDYYFNFESIQFHIDSKWLTIKKQEKGTHIKERQYTSSEDRTKNK